VRTSPGNRLGFSCGTAVNGLKQSLAPWMGGVSRERSLQKITILVVDDSLENCHRFASNNDVVLPCLRVRISNCAKKSAHGAANLNCAKKVRMAQPIWLKLDEIAGTLGGIYGAVGLLNVSNLDTRQHVVIFIGVSVRHG